MPSTTTITPESGVPAASVKIIRFYYICIACVLTGAATFITGIIGTAVTYSNFAASAGTGIWTSIFVSIYTFCKMILIIKINRFNIHFFEGLNI